jgi:hypothetical protein
MITSNMARAGDPGRVIVSAGSEGAKVSGLLMDSVIMADNLATIHYSEVDRSHRDRHNAEGNRCGIANDPRIIAGGRYARLGNAVMRRAPSDPDLRKADQGAADRRQLDLLADDN